MVSSLHLYEKKMHDFTVFHNNTLIQTAKYNTVTMNVLINTVQHHHVCK